MTLPGLAAALVFSYFSHVPGPAYRIFPLDYGSAYSALQLDLQLGWRSLLNSVLGAAIGAGTLYGVGLVYLALRKVEGMGLGDVKLMAMAGAFLGPSLTLFVLSTKLTTSANAIFLQSTAPLYLLLLGPLLLGEHFRRRDWPYVFAVAAGLSIRRPGDR